MHVSIGKGMRFSGGDATCSCEMPDMGEGN